MSQRIRDLLNNIKCRISVKSSCCITNIDHIEDNEIVLK